MGDTLIDTARRPGRPSASYELEPDRLQRVLGESFELGRLIGRGGYAEVFAVRDLKLKGELTIKVLRPDLVVTANSLARFRAVAGNPDAQYELGMIYIKGKGVPKSEAVGIAWLRKAAEAGHDEAKKELASRRSS